MYKVTRELLTSTSEKRSGFDTADDEFETDDDRGLRGRSSNTYRLSSKSKDFRSTDEDADADDWQDTDTFVAVPRFYGSNTLNSNASGKSKTPTLDSKGKCTCCPYGYHVDLDFLKHLHAEEYENVRNDPQYLIKHHRRLHQLQQQQFQERASTLSTAAATGASTTQSFQQQQQQQQQQQSHFQQPQSHFQQPQQTHLQQQQYHHLQQQHQSTLRKSPYSSTTIFHPQQPKEEPTYENALAIYNKSASGGSHATMSSTTRTTLGRDPQGRMASNGYYPATYSTTTNGYDPDGDGTRRQETVVVGEDGSTTTRVVEEIHKTRTTIINYDTDEDDGDSPQKRPGVGAPRKPKPSSSPEPEDVIFEGNEKLSRRQQHLLELQKKLQQIQPIDQKGPLRTYVNAASPKPVTEDDKESPEKINKNRLPNFRQRPEDEDDGVDKRSPVGKPHPDPDKPDPAWSNEREEYLRKIRDLELDRLQEQMEREAYEKKIGDLEDEKRKREDEFRNQLTIITKEKRALDNQLKSKKPTMDAGVGDQSIDEEIYTTTKHFQIVGTPGQQPVRIHEKELNTEETTEIREKEVKTIFVSGIDDKFSLAAANQASVHRGAPVFQQKESKSIGVGDGNVFDDSQSRFEVHEKELRTVYLGGPEHGKVATRNVGILCKAAMRDVGMVHSSNEEKPLVKNVAVGAGEIGVSESEINFAREGTTGEGSIITNQELALRGPGEPDDESYFASSGFCHTTLTNIKGGGLAGLRGDQLKAYLDEMLKRTVRSIATQCQFSTENKGTDAARVGYDIASVGVSDDTIDVEVIPIRVMKTVAIDNRPSLFHRCIGTDFVFKLDVGTNTKTQGLFTSRTTNTDPKPCLPAATMTDPTRLQNAQTMIELPIFFALDQLRTTGVMTDDVDMYNKRVNTETDEETQQRIGSSRTSSSSMAASSTSHSSDIQEIRRGEEHATGYRRYVEEKVTPGYLISHTTTTRSRSGHEGSSPTRPSSSGKTDRSTGYTATTLVHTTKDKSPRKVVTFEGEGATNQLLGLDRVTKTSNATGADGTTQYITETIGPGYTERVVKETYSSTDGKTVGIPLAPGVGGFPEHFFKDDSHSTTSSSKSTYMSSNQSTTPVVPESINKTKLMSESSATTTKTEVDEKTGMKRLITERKGPGYSETIIKSSYTSGEIGGNGFGIEFTADPSGGVSSQSVKGPYYTEKTVSTGDAKGGALIDVEFTGGSGSAGMIQTTEDGKHYITEVQYPGRPAQVVFETDGSIPIQIDESGVSIGGGTSGQLIKSSTTTEKRTYTTSGSSSGEGRHTLALRDQSNAGQGGAQVGIKTIIKESYGPNNIKTVTTEKVDMKTGKVISSETKQSHFDSLPTFDSATSSRFATSAFDFAKSGFSTEKFVPDQDLAASSHKYVLWLKDKSQVTQAQLEESQSTLQNRWFYIAGAEGSNVHLVVSFMNYLDEMSPELLKYVINLTDANGNGVLHFALSHGNMDVADVILETNLVDVNKANSVGNTPVLISALTVEPTEHNVEVLKKLFAKGNVNATAYGSGQTALMLASGRGRVEIVKLLLSSCCQCDINIKDADGYTALMYAAQKGSNDIVKVLLATGKCDIHAKSNDGTLAIDVAKEMGHQFIVSLLESYIKESEKK